MPATQQHRMAAIETVLGKDKLVLRQCTVQEPLGRPFQIEVELASEDPEIPFDDIIGTNATIRLQLPKGGSRYFNGFIGRFAQSEQQQRYALYRATLMPWLWFLTRAADCRIFQKKKTPEILEEVFKGQGFTDYKLSLTNTHREWEYCVQYRETDFNFVSRLMEQEGIYYFFVHENGKHTLVLADSPAAHSPFEGYEELIYCPPTHQAEETAERVTAWTIEKEVQPGLYALHDFNFKSPNAPLSGNANISREHAAAGFEMFDYPGEFEYPYEGDAYAKLRIEELQAQHEVLRGQTNAHGLATGCKFKLRRHPRADQDREYLVTSVAMNIMTDGYASAGQERAGEFYTCGFTAMPFSEQFRTPRATPKPVVQGPQTAIVVGKKGEEIETDEYGRVKVQFHWDRVGRLDENSSCWIRVSQACAGKGWGAITLPRVGQEVIVEFLEGDPDRPIITGRVYNAAAHVPYDLPAHKTMSTFKSLSSKEGGGFNEIRFEDEKGKEQVFINGEKNLDIRVKNDAFEFIGNDGHLIVKRDHYEHVENNQHLKVDADRMEKIGKDLHLKVVGKEAKEVGDSLSLTVKGDVTEAFKANHSEETANDYYLKAMNIVIEAMTNVTIKVGKSSIAFEAGGVGIKTDGQIKLESTGPFEIKATGPLKMESVATADVKSATTSIKGDGMVVVQGGVVKIN